MSDSFPTALAAAAGPTLAFVCHCRWYRDGAYHYAATAGDSDRLPGSGLRHRDLQVIQADRVTAWAEPDGSTRVQPLDAQAT